MADRQHYKATYRNYWLLKYIVVIAISLFIMLFNVFNKPLAFSISYNIHQAFFNSYEAIVNIPQHYRLMFANKGIIKDLTLENQQLKSQLEKFKQLNIQNKQLSLENQELKTLLNVIHTTPFTIKHLITTTVLSPNLSANSSYVTLNLGSKNGLFNLAPVLSSNNLIGSLVSVTTNHALIMLVTNSKSKIPVFTLSSKNDAIMGGNNSKNPVITTYKQGSANFVEGEVVVTSGLGSIFPRNIPIGTLHKATNNTWVVNLYSNIYNLNYIHIILASKNEKKPI